MRIFIISTGLLLFINVLNASPIPISIESDESSSSEENGVVYIQNIYAMRNTNTREVARILSQISQQKVPPMFESLGSILALQTDPDEPYTLAEMGEFMEPAGISLTKLNIGEQIFELKMEAWEELTEIMAFDEWFEYLEDEGIMLKMSIEGNKKVIEVKFDESVKDSEDRPFTLEQFAEYFENEEIMVETVEVHGEIRAIRLIFEYSHAEDSEKSEERDNEPATTQRIDEIINEIEKKDDKLNEIEHKEEKKVGKNIENKIEKNYVVDKKEGKDKQNDDRFVTLDFTTRADSMNKIRRRRSICPECKLNNLIKEFAAKFDRYK